MIYLLVCLSIPIWLFGIYITRVYLKVYDLYEIVKNDGSLSLIFILWPFILIWVLFSVFDNISDKKAKEIIKDNKLKEQSIREFNIFKY